MVTVFIEGQTVLVVAGISQARGEYRHLGVSAYFVLSLYIRHINLATVGRHIRKKRLKWVSMYGYVMYESETKVKPGIMFRRIIVFVVSERFKGLGGGVGEAGAVPSYIYGIVRMCVPNGPLFQRCQVYDWPPFLDKMYMADPIFLDWYMKGPTFSDVPVYAHIFHSEIFETACSLGIQ